jgi:hypothetical protein
LGIFTNAANIPDEIKVGMRKLYSKIIHSSGNIDNVVTHIQSTSITDKVLENFKSKEFEILLRQYVENKLTRASKMKKLKLKTKIIL